MKWQQKIKLSEDPEKVNNPGILQVRRYHAEEFLEDVIYDEEHGIPASCAAVNLEDPTQTHAVPVDSSWIDLLVPVFRNGEAIYKEPSLGETRERAQTQLAQLPSAVKELNRPQGYPVSLERSLHERKEALIRQAQQPPPA